MADAGKTSQAEAKRARAVLWLLRHPRWHLHFIPTHASGLNQVERSFAKITFEVIRREWFTSVPNLRKAILAHISTDNRAHL